MSGGKAAGPSAQYREVARALTGQVARNQVDQKSLAKAIGVSQSTISRFLRGTKVPNLDQAEAMCKFLGLDLVRVLREAEAQTVGDDVATESTPSGLHAARKNGAATKGEGRVVEGSHTGVSPEIVTARQAEIDAQEGLSDHAKAELKEFAAGAPGVEAVVSETPKRRKAK